jgi:hypothetical protein
VPKWSQKLSKVCQSGTQIEKRVPRWKPKLNKDHQKEPLRETIDFGCQDVLRVGYFGRAAFVNNALKMPSKIHSKLDREQLWKLMRKGFQIEGEIDAKTHYKSMQKLIANNRVEVMNNHVFLQGPKLDFERRTQYCCSKTRVARVSGGAMSVCKNDGQSMTNPFQNGWKFCEKSLHHPYSKKSC